MKISVFHFRTLNKRTNMQAQLSDEQLMKQLRELPAPSTEPGKEKKSCLNEFSNEFFLNLEKKKNMELNKQNF